jgi:hypothetical protein
MQPIVRQKWNRSAPGTYLVETLLKLTAREIRGESLERLLEYKSQGITGAIAASEF